MRERINLNFNWYYSKEFKSEYCSNIDKENFIMVNIPHTVREIPYNYFDEKIFQFISCYGKVLNLADTYEGRRLLLHFDGVANYAEVFLNGNLLTSHKGGYTPFSIDITNNFNFNTDNLLIVKVDSTERDDIPPFGRVVDYLGYGGIYREVYLDIVNKTHINDVFIKTRNVLKINKDLDVRVTLSEYNEGYNDYLEFKLEDNSNKIIKTFTKKVDNYDILSITVLENVALWDIDTPNLYTLRINLIRGSKVIDSVTKIFGFREVEFKPDGFYLNKKRIKLRGLNRHQSYPYVGYAMPKRAQYEDVEILKNKLGVNIVRLSHYPQSHHFLDYCDKLGLLVFCEIPGWQYIGNEAWKNVAKTNLEEMITAYFNHPSIIIWGVRINESSDDRILYSEMNHTARLLDDTRPTGGVRNFAGSEFLEDVYTYNDFLHSGTNPGLSRRKKIIKKKVPYLVTEHNGHMFPTKKFDQESKRIEHALRHLRVLDAMYKNSDISGSIGWCMADYNTHKDFGSGDGICHHGVMDMFRIPKTASFSYSSQQDRYPVMHISSDMNIGEYDASQLSKVIIFTNCDYVKVYKNDKYIGTFYPDKKKFKYLPHPPIIVSDFIGDALEKNEPFTKKDARRLKTVFHAISKGGKLPLKTLVTMGYLMIKYKMNYRKGYDLYTKYVNNWGSIATRYQFYGYKDDKQVCQVIKGPSYRHDLIVNFSTTTLIEDLTYDCARFELRAVDENQNDLIYENETIIIETTGPIDVIGPKTFSLIGGSRAFWLRSTGLSGKAQVRIKSTSFMEKQIELNVYKK